VRVLLDFIAGMCLLFGAGFRRRVQFGIGLSRPESFCI
jgi:hypothetical protein